jgi:2'-deoxymugineic-acid 2'-dioxygenase / mugineic-acid 3-dioxygenase
MELLRLLCEGMGLRADYFDGDLSGGDVVVNVNHYPPCPDPLRTLGLPPHCDRNLITLLRADGPGLQVACRGGGWTGVDPVPDAFVVNGLLRSVQHRAVPDAARTRTSIATFLMPTDDCLVRPTEGLIGEGPRYRAVTFREFMGVYRAVGACRKSVEKAFRI